MSGVAGELKGESANHLHISSVFPMTEMTFRGTHLSLKQPHLFLEMLQKMNRNERTVIHPVTLNF